jgi:hypothetical protein
MTNSDNGQTPEQTPTPGTELRPMEPNERIIRANGVDLCVQTFGDRADPPPSSSSWEGLVRHLYGLFRQSRTRVLRSLPVRTACQHSLCHHVRAKALTPIGLPTA